MTLTKQDKIAVLNHLLDETKSKLKDAQLAYNTAKEHASKQELKAESKHDTRGIEAGYLAGAQQRRVYELEQDLKLLEEINLEHDHSTVSVGSLVCAHFNGIDRYYFISSTAGGTLVKVGDQTVLVISAFSPIGTEMINLSAGDSFTVETANETREYTVQSIS